MTRVAIIGGGPGGLMTAHLLEQKCSCRSDAVRGKRSSRRQGPNLPI